MADVQAFIKKWNGRTLEDAGCYVSKEYQSFQTAFINAMKKIAADMGGTVVNAGKGHYDLHGFIQVGNKYVYFSYDNSLDAHGRTHIALTGSNYWEPLLLRTAKDAKDYRGGENNYSCFAECQSLIKKLLAE